MRKTEKDLDFWIDRGIDIEGRKLVLDEDVDDFSVGPIIRGIATMEKRSSSPITLYINTYGGGCYDGLALYDVLRASPCEIVTVGSGKVISMGTLLMLAGDIKKAYKNTTFMWHTISHGFEGKLFETNIDVTEAKRVFDRLLDIYAERSLKPKSFWLKWLKHEDRYGDVNKATELGFVDEEIK